MTVLLEDMQPGSANQITDLCHMTSNSVQPKFCICFILCKSKDVLRAIYDVIFTKYIIR